MIDFLRNCERSLISTSHGLEQTEPIVVALRAEELIDKRVEDLVIELVVNLATEDRLRDERAKGIPRDLVWIDIGTILTHAVEPFIDAIKRAPLISLIKLVHFRPTDRCVAESLLDNRIEP